MRKAKAYSLWAWKRMMEYKVSFYTSFITPFFTLLIFIFLWPIVFANIEGSFIGGLTLEEMILYSLITIVVGNLVGGLGRISNINIRNGNILTDLTRPIKHNVRVFFTYLTRRIFEGIIFLPIVFSAFFMLNLPGGQGAFEIVLFLISLFLAFIIAFFLMQSVAFLAFWSDAVSDVRHIIGMGGWFLGGGFIPITVFPSLLQKILVYLPFQYMRFTPVYILMGKYTLVESLIQIGIQLIWICLLFILMRWVWKKGLNRFDAQGG